MGKFVFREALDSQGWDRFVQASPQGTLFSTSGYLRAAVPNFRNFFVFKGEQIKAGVSLVLDAQGRACVLDDLVIYGGILFANGDQRKETRARNERFELTEFIISELDRRFDAIELPLAPQFEDLRPFLWHNYHSDNPQDRFTPDLRYTSYLNIAELQMADEPEQTGLFKGLETLRQRNIREARKNQVSLESIRKPELVVDYYRALMAAQGERCEAEKLERMEGLIGALIDTGRGRMFLSRDGSGKALYATVFCLDDKRAYYLFGAPNPDSRERYKGTIAFWDAFITLARDDQTRVVDLEGVNSPRRGWFKLSFGGDLRPYYQVYKSSKRQI